MYPQFLFLLAMIALSAIFSGSETALVSVRPGKVNELVAKKRANAKILKKLKKDPHKLLITVLIGNNIVNVGASGYAAVLFTDLFGSSGVGIATGVMTFFILIFGEIVPKSFAHQHSAGFSLVVARPIYYLQILLFPFVWFFRSIVALVNKISGSKKTFTVTEGELVAMVEIGAKEGSINTQERDFIENILEFNDIEVEDIMTPRVAIEALDCDSTLKDAVDFVIKKPHSRIPVYEGSIDNIVGVIPIKELLKYFDRHSPRKKLKGLKLIVPLEVPHSKKIDQLFREFQRRHIHMAIVIDEHGGTAGLVTMEDLLEEIVGDIVDESDVHENPIEIIDSKNIIVTGKTMVEDINDFFKIKFGSKEHDTISTMLTEELHRFPREGEVVRFPLAKVHILEMGKKLVKKVKITKMPKLAREK